MIAKVTLPSRVGFIGKEHNVMVVHMHNDLANLVHGVKKLEEFWGWLSEKIQEFKVQVLMGDFNMSLFRVIPELRSRGTVIDLGAWYPWKSLEGEPMSDSCGIFFVGLPGVYALNKNINDLHDQNIYGVLKWAKKWDDEDAPFPVAVEDDEDDGDVAPPAHSADAELCDDSDEGEDLIRKENGGFDRIHDNAGPGKSLTTYLPKEDSLVEKLRPSLTPSDASAAVADPRGSARQKGGIKLKEKRLDARLWRYKGKHQRGSHFPICVSTNNVGRRSPQKLEERKEKQKQRPWYVPKWSQRSRTNEWQSRTKEWQGLQEDADPQQGEQPRPEEDQRKDSFGRWKDCRRGRRSDWQPINSGTWPSGTWPKAHGHDAAVAASEPMKVDTQLNVLQMPIEDDSRLWSDYAMQSPAGALRAAVNREAARLAD